MLQAVASRRGIRRNDGLAGKYKKHYSPHKRNCLTLDINRQVGRLG